MKQFISLAANLQTFSSPQFSYHKAIQQLIQQTEWEHHALVPKTCAIPALPEKWIPFFHGKNERPFLQTMNRFLDFSRAFLKSRKKERIFFLESFNTADFAAFTFASLFFAKKRDTLWVLFRQNTSLLPCKGKVHACCMKLLRRKRLNTFTDSELIQKDFAQKFGLALHTVPVPHADYAFQQSNSPKKILTAWWPGEPHKSHGMEEIQRLLFTDDPGASHFTFFLSRKTPLREPPALRFQILPDILPRELYNHFLFQSDVVLLPYDPAVYQARTSGIFIEAIIAGKIPLVKAGSWLAYELKKYDLEELIVEWDNPSFFSHIFALAQQTSIQQKLKKMREKYLSIHSTANFFETIRHLL